MNQHTVCHTKNVLRDLNWYQYYPDSSDYKSWKLYEVRCALVTATFSFCIHDTLCDGI